jgi:hypothetical protein
MSIGLVFSPERLNIRLLPKYSAIKRTLETMLPGDFVVVDFPDATGNDLKYLRRYLKARLPFMYLKYKKVKDNKLKVTFLNDTRATQTEQSIFNLTDNIYSLLKNHPNRKAVRVACAKILYGSQF